MKLVASVTFGSLLCGLALTTHAATVTFNWNFGDGSSRARTRMPRALGETRPASQPDPAAAD
jgi:hypothetical protein